MNEQFSRGLNHPVDIAYSLMRVAGYGIGTEVEKNIEEVMYQLQATADNPYNAQYWRDLYSMLSAIADKQEYQPLPFN